MKEFFWWSQNKKGIVRSHSRLGEGQGMDWRKLSSMHVVFKWYLRLGCETAVLLVFLFFFFFLCQLSLFDWFSLWQPTVLINVSTVAALLQTPVSVSLAGVGPTAPVVSFHLLLSVSACCCCMGSLVCRLSWTTGFPLVPCTEYGVGSQSGSGIQFLLNQYMCYTDITVYVVNWG